MSIFALATKHNAKLSRQNIWWKCYVCVNHEHDEKCNFFFFFFFFFFFLLVVVVVVVVLLLLLDFYGFFREDRQRVTGHREKEGGHLLQRATGWNGAWAAAVRMLLHPITFFSIL